MTSNSITNVGSITCNTLACTGTGGTTSTPTRRGVYMGLDSTASGGIEICTDMNQYIDFTTMSNDYRGRINYITTNNDLKMYVNGSATPSLTLKQHSMNDKYDFWVSWNIQLYCMHRDKWKTYNTNK